METLCPDSPVLRSLYEQEELSLVTGGALRPGGLALTSELITSCRVAPGAAVLDVGCGPGHTMALLASGFGLRPTGLDPSGLMLARAARLLPAASLLQGVATAIPCGQHSFDMVITECVLSLTGDLEQSFREIYRVLRPAGRLIVTDIYCKGPEAGPALPNLKSCISQARPLASIEQALDTAGFIRHTLRDRSDLLRQLAGEIIFRYGSLERFWQQFMGAEAARRTCCSLAAVPLGYYVLIAQKGPRYG
jgi:arsenite methyltransferase